MTIHTFKPHSENWWICWRMPTTGIRMLSTWTPLSKGRVRVGLGLGGSRVRNSAKIRVAAVPQLDGFQAGEQATLLLVEQTVEEQNSGLEFFGRYLQSGSIGHQRNRLCRFPGAELISSLATFDGSVRKRPVTSERRRRPARTRSCRGSWTSAWRVSASSSAKQPRGD